MISLREEGTMEGLSPCPASESLHTSLHLLFGNTCIYPRSVVLQSSNFFCHKDRREAVWLEKSLFFPSFWIPFFLQSTSTPPSHTHTGPRGNSKFPFMLLIIGACWYFMRPCKPLNYCTLKCILTLLRDHVDGQAFHCWSGDRKWWTTKEHDLLIIFNCRIKMVTK